MSPGPSDQECGGGGGATAEESLLLKDLQNHPKFNLCLVIYFI